MSLKRQISILTEFFFLGLILLVAGCSLEKESGFNRTMQNLTAHYNILFNANQLLTQKQDEYALSFVDNYNQILSVYTDTVAKSAAADKDLDAVVIKANNIINIKEQSHYIGDAYLLLGKANYLGANYYNAIEYFNYVTRSFPKQTELRQQALEWKARSLLYLNQLPLAKLTLDTALINTDPKKHIPAEVYGAKLQYDITAEDYADAETAAKDAIKYCSYKSQRLRWTFILAQVQELNNKPADAYKNYTSIVNSNASFEMAFNADLNRIRIKDVQSGRNVSRIDRLKSLLKNQNNKEFTDQIYYQIAEFYYAQKDIVNAIKYYKLSVRFSLKNQTQKGLSYLRLAEINFKIRADYVLAKKYYDSTLTNLSTHYPGYTIIQKTGANLQLLADRLQTISREDTLQMLARLDETSRNKRIDQMVTAQVLKEQDDATAAALAATNTANNNNSGGGPGVVGNSNFYFYNSSAISQGYADFKRKWGTRRLEDDWRRSSRQNTNNTANTTNPFNVTNNMASQNLDPDAVSSKLQKSVSAVNAANYRQQIVQGLPLSPLRLQQSNDRIYNAYLDIANFYRDILGDKKQAIVTYELLLKRFPDNANRPAIYYNLYRLYSDDNPELSAQYRDKLLKEFPETPFARIIADPEYGKKLSDKDAEFNGFYNQLYELYAKRQYEQVITNADALIKQYPDNKFSAQVYYLRAMAAGHNETLAPFEADLQQMIAKFPYDRLIIPLVNQYLAYINTNRPEVAARAVIITDNDAPFSLAPAQQVLASNNPTTDVKKSVTAPSVTVPQASLPAVKAPANAAKEKVTLFSNRDSSNYYFVINVASGTTNLASSRFGIGQFNRANYQENTIKHQLVDAGNDNQLIYVGRFSGINAVKDYARAIIPLLPEIMKVPKDKYSFFIITKENLDKLADKKALDSYTDYYQKNY